MRKWIIRGSLLSLLVSPAIARAGAPQANPVAVKEDDASAEQTPEWVLQTRDIIDRGADAAKELSPEQREDFLDDTGARLAYIKNFAIDEETRQILAKDAAMTEKQANLCYMEAKVDIDAHYGRVGVNEEAKLLEYARYIVKQTIASSPATDKTNTAPTKATGPGDYQRWEKRALAGILHNDLETVKKLSEAQKKILIEDVNLDFENCQPRIEMSGS